MSSSRLADEGDGNATGRARCYALVLNWHCRLWLEGLEIRAKGVLRKLILNAATRGGGGCNGNADDNIGGHPKGAATGAVSIVCHYNNVINRIAVVGKPDAGAESERLDKMFGTPSPLGSLSLSSRRCQRMEVAVVSPDHNSYNTVMKAYTNAHGTRGKDRILVVINIILISIIISIRRSGNRKDLKCVVCRPWSVVCVN